MRGGGSQRCRMETESLISLSPSVRCTPRHMPRGKKSEPEANPRLTLKRKICGVFLQFSIRFRVVIFMSNSKFTLHERSKVLTWGTGFAGLSIRSNSLTKPSDSVYEGIFYEIFCSEDTCFGLMGRDTVWFSSWVLVFQGNVVSILRKKVFLRPSTQILGWKLPSNHRRPLFPNSVQYISHYVPAQLRHVINLMNYWISLYFLNREN
jgi:hypothetical protein